VGTDDSKHTVITTNMTTEIRAIFPKTLGPLKGHWKLSKQGSRRSAAKGVC
jgi:hypothetical protein